MKWHDMIRDLHLVDARVLNSLEVNPLAIAVQYEFDNPGPNFRERAIDRVIQAEVSFQSEDNTVSLLVPMIFRQVVCPKCGKNVKADSHSGGTSHRMGFSYTCKCGCKVSLGISSDAIGVTSPEKT